VNQKLNQPVMTAAEVTAFLDREFPQLLSGHGQFVIESVGPMTARVRLIYDERHLRPGGTLSGPSMFGLCDVSLYIAILAEIGPVALAVTTNLNINFLRRPQARDLIGECRLIKLGKRLAVGEVDIRSEGEDELVAHVTSTYSIPPQAS
jgi:uncharacterized protein (TIGR00369 family)